LGKIPDRKKTRNLEQERDDGSSGVNGTERWAKRARIMGISPFIMMEISDTSAENRGEGKRNPGNATGRVGLFKECGEEVTRGGAP